MLYTHNAAIGTDWNLFFGIIPCSKNKILSLCNFFIFYFPNLASLVPRLIICLLISDDWKCLTFGFKVGGAPWGARKRETWGPPWRPCRGLTDSNPFPLDRAQKVAPPPPPILDKNNPTRIELMNKSTKKMSIEEYN